MKNFLTIGILGITATLSSCSNNSAPASVLSAFEQKYPSASSVEWSKENAQEWEAEFTMDNKSCSANFSTDGEWLETEITIPSESIPSEVAAAVHSKYPDYQIEAAESVETFERKAYELEITSEASTLELLISDSGEILNKKDISNEKTE